MQQVLVGLGVGIARKGARMVGRRRMIDTLTRRINAFERGNPGVVLDPQALVEAGELLRRGTRDGGAISLEVASAVAWLHWCRHLALPGSQDQHDLRAALRLFTAIAAVDARAVPEPLRQYVTADGNSARLQAQAAPGLVRQTLHTGDPVALSQAIELLDKAVATTPAGHPDRPMYLSNLGAALQTRFLRSGADADLDEAVRVGRQAVAATPAGHPDRPMYLSNLGGALQIRFERTGADGDLDEAVEVGREAVAGPADHADYAGWLHNLGSALQARFERTGVDADLDEAVRVGREAVGAIPADHPDRAHNLSSLSVALLKRFERMGTDADLEEAVEVGREAVDATPAGHPDRGMYLANLGAVLRTRFERTGASADLDEVVRIRREAVAATPADDPKHAGMLSALGVDLRARFRRTGADADLDEAVRVGREAVAGTSTDHPDRAKWLAGLGNTLQSRFERSGADTDLDEAVEVRRQAVDATPTDHPDRARYLSNLGGALQTRFGRTGTGAELDEAVLLGREAVNAIPEGHPDRAGMLSNLSVALRLRFERTGDDADLDEALGKWAQACSSTLAPVTTRLIAGRGWAQATAQWRGPAAAVEAYTEAVNLLPLLAWRGIAQQDQQHLLQVHAASLARDGAACAIAAGRLNLAVELLEQGRGVFWSQLLDGRTDLTELQQVAPHLARQLLHCRAVLEQSTAPTSSPTPVQVEARMRAARCFDELVGQVRASPPTALFPHPEAFLKLPAINTLLPGSDGESIVIVNISQWRCDALILTHHGITLVELPELTEQQVIDLANRYLYALQGFEQSQHTSADRLALESGITRSLHWLWDAITAPILTELGHTSTPPTRGPGCGGALPAPSPCCPCMPPGTTNATAATPSMTGSCPITPPPCAPSTTPALGQSPSSRRRSSSSACPTPRDRTSCPALPPNNTSSLRSSPLPSALS